MHHAPRIIEAFAINRQARMPCAAEDCKQLRESSLERYSSNVGTRDHQVANVHLIQRKDVLSKARSWAEMSSSGEASSIASSISSRIEAPPRPNKERSRSKRLGLPAVLGLPASLAAGPL